MGWVLLGVVAGTGAVACSPAAYSASESEERGQSQQAVTNSSYVPAGYMCKVNDEFGGDLGGGQPNSLIDGGKWTFQNVYVNNELQNYTNRQCADSAHVNDWNYCVTGGALTIRARNDGINCVSNANCAQNWQAAGVNKSYSSGRMISKNKVALQYGYIEFRARLPFQGGSSQSGVWPAIWFLGNNINEGPPPGSTAWPWAPELDLMEFQSPTSTMASNAIFIGGDGNMDSCNAWPEGGSVDCTPSTWTVNRPFNIQGWHTYGLLWTSSRITAYVDGVSQGYVTTTGNANEYNNPMFMIMNMAVGGDLGGAVQVTDWTKVTLDVDYMRWYQSGGSDTCGGTTCTAESNTAFCSRLGKNCGSVTANDNCGTSRTVSSCGTCTSPQTCAGGGTANVCGGSTCTAESNTAFCSRLGKSCGSVTANDNCGTSRTVSSCGTCASPQTCAGGGTANVCGGGAGITIEAESFTGTGGGNNVGKETCSEGGQNVMDVGDGEWVKYDNVNFAGVTSFQARVAGASFATTIEFRRDSRTGTLMGTCSAPITGGWQTWTTVSCTATGTTGTGSLYLVFHGGSANSQLANVNWIKLFGGGTCTAESNTAFCSRLGKNCGSVTANDNCGASRTVSSCGTCTSPQTCAGGGTANVCGSASASCSSTVSGYALGKCDATAVYSGKLYKCISQAAGVNGSAQCGSAGVYCSNIPPTDAAWGTTAWQFLQNCP